MARTFFDFGLAHDLELPNFFTFVEHGYFECVLIEGLIALKQIIMLKKSLHNLN